MYLAQGHNTAEVGLTPESETLPLGHCAPRHSDVGYTTYFREPVPAKIRGVHTYATFSPKCIIKPMKWHAC